MASRGDGLTGPRSGEFADRGTEIRDIVFPKSVTTERIRENIDIFDFELSDDQIDAITSLDKGVAGRRGPDPDTFDWIPK